MTKAFAWNEFGKLKTNEDINIYLSGREFRHNKFCHYTNLVAIDKILGSMSFHLSNVSMFNDLCDSEQFGTEKEQRYYYSLCFSTGINENLALWYLYAGMQGKGGRIVFSGSLVKKLIEGSSYSLSVIENGRIVHIKEKLEPNKDFKIIFKDIIYFQDSEDKDITDLKYNTMTNHIFPKNEFDTYKKHNTGFQKNLIWYYEKETRLLVQILSARLKKMIDEAFEQKRGSVKVILNFNKNIYNNISINFAPEIDIIDMEYLSKNYSHIKEFLLSSSKVKLSRYYGKIKMDLCAKCSKN